MYRRMMVSAIALCAVFTTSGGTHNDALLSRKLVKSAGDPELLTYFRIATRWPAGALTRKTRASRALYTVPARVLREQTISQSATPISNGMMETKTQHSSTTFDLTVSPSFYDDDYDDEDQKEELSGSIEEDEDRHAGGHEVDEHPGVLTRPNYPGRGKWAQRGLKHVPYVHTTNPYNKKYINHKPTIIPNPYNPHENLGHHILGRQRKKFIRRFPLAAVPVPSPQQKAPPRQPVPTFHINRQPQSTPPPPRLPIYQNFQQELQQLQDLPYAVNNDHQIAQGFPQHGQPYNHIQQAYNNYQIPAPKGYEMYHKKVIQKPVNTYQTPKLTTEFVPTRMYAQVRHIEHESHMPINISEPRLRQISKDARIHTVYTEEGYEDGAYDHAGEEKHAEEDEAREEHIGRERRSIDNFDSMLQVDTDFIGQLKYAQGEPPPIASVKYPYYNNAYINPNSPLRYAQHPNDIPNKQAGNLAFYEDREARVHCDEVVPVNPIPEELDAGGENAPVKPYVPKTPRLGKLGNQIECFRVRYFGGEDPLDNPIFKESLVAAPVSMLIQTPLLHEVESKLSDAARLGKSLAPTLHSQSNQRNNQQKEQAWDASAQTVVRQNESKDNQTILIVSTTTSPPASAKALPEAEALRMRRIYRRPPRPHHNVMLHQNRYVSRPAYKPLDHLGTPPPLHNTLSEVYYKDQIKPSEQLNVFADVINHIQNMTRNDAYAAGSDMHVDNTRPVQNPPSAMSIRSKNNNNNSMGGRDVNKVQRKKRKRKHPVMKSTQELYNEFMRRSKKHPARLYEHVNHALPNDTRMGMIHMPAEPPSGLGDTQQTYYSTIEIPVNKFLVPGMKPPLAVEKPFIYADFQADNMLKRRNWLNNHRLVRRKRANRKYEQIRRQPVTRVEEVDEPDEPEDDYVPHRHKNYHYDPDTGRIVYDEKPANPSEMSVEEMINGYFEEMEQETEHHEDTTTTTTTTPRPHRTVYHDDVLNKANGETLVDFITKLKTHPSYKPIADPEPIKEGVAPSPTTVRPKSTTPPMFLKLLEKLHNNKGYIKIEDEAVKKKKTTMTEEHQEQAMKESIVEEEAEEDEEELPKNVRNSPGGQFVPESAKLQIFDITEYLPKVKTYTPRTSIDYSKYKNIERPPSRHNYSSRYNEEKIEEAPARPIAAATDIPQAAKYQTTPPRYRRPLLDNEEIVEVVEKTDPAEVEAIVEEIADMIAATSMTTTTTTTTLNKLMQEPKIRVRQRNRTTRRPTRTTMRTVTTSTQKDESTQSVHTGATHRPASRVYPRHNRPRVRLRSTTSTSTSTPYEDDDDPKEGAESRVPTNHKRSYTPLTISKLMDDDSIMLMQRRPRLVTSEIISFSRSTYARRQRNPVKNAHLSAPL